MSFEIAAHNKYIEFKSNIICSQQNKIHISQNKNIITYNYTIVN